MHALPLRDRRRRLPGSGAARRHLHGPARGHAPTLPRRRLRYAAALAPAARELHAPSRSCDVVMPVLEYPGAAARRVRERCLDPMRERLEAGQLKITGFLGAVHVCYMREAECRAFDPDLRRSSTPTPRTICDSPRCYCVKTQPSDHLDRSTVGGQPQHAPPRSEKRRGRQPRHSSVGLSIAPTHPLVARRNLAPLRSLRYAPRDPPCPRPRRSCITPCLTASDSGILRLFSRFSIVPSALNADLTSPGDTACVGLDSRRD